MDKFRTS